jgi:hypothetical protein
VRVKREGGKKKEGVESEDVGREDALEGVEWKEEQGGERLCCCRIQTITSRQVLIGLSLIPCSLYTDIHMYLDQTPAN